jgi:XTP/dITP diphosphohydrolase
MKAILASQNAHKARELERLLPGWHIDVLDAGDYPPETGETYYENARGKARFARERAPADAWALGEDSGIEVDGLDGAPGVRSSRSATGDEVGWMLDALDGMEGAARRARYVSELVALAPDGRELRGTGTLSGRVAAEARGDEGFGFDPVFVPDGEERTVAELGDGWKSEHSHRANAARDLLRQTG